MKILLATLFGLILLPAPPIPDWVPITQIGINDKTSTIISGCEDGRILWSATQESVWKEDHREQQTRWVISDEQKPEFVDPRRIYQCWLKGKSPVDKQ